MSKTPCTLAAAAFTFIWAVPVLAQPKPTEPSKDHVKALIAQARQNIAQQPPTSTAEPAPQGPVVNLSEQDAVTMARDKNITLAAERITPETWDFTIAATRAVKVNQSRIRRDFFPN